MTFNSLLTAVALALTTFGALAADAAVDVQNAWARATVTGQMASGAFMTLTAKEGATLVGVASPVVGVAQVHEMRMDAGVMKMGAVKGGLALPAGKAVELKSGGYHIMLMDLKAPLAKGSTLALTLTFSDARGVESKLELKVPVAAVAPTARGQASAMDHATHNMHTTPPAGKQ